MSLIDFVKWEAQPDRFAWRYPSDQLSTWTQLIVNESQEAYLVKGGQYLGPFGAGRHTLATENVPGLAGLIDVPFGRKSPFTSEVWFVNKVANLDIRWGTPDPIQLQDPRYQLMLPVRAYGQYGVRIADGRKFLNRLVGTLPAFDAVRLSEYFRGVLITRTKTEIANAIIKNGQSVLEVSTQLEKLSDMLRESLSPDLAAYGVMLSQFNINSISVPDDDPAVKTLKTALAKRAEMSIVGFNYQQERSFDVMQQAAANEGVAGTVMGSGLGLGMGAVMGGNMGGAFNSMSNQLRVDDERPQAPPSVVSTQERLQALREIGELKAQGILSDAEFESEKKRILGL